MSQNKISKDPGAALPRKGNARLLDPTREDPVGREKDALVVPVAHHVTQVETGLKDPLMQAETGPKDLLMRVVEIDLKGLLMRVEIDRQDPPMPVEIDRQDLLMKAEGQAPHQLEALDPIRVKDALLLDLERDALERLDLERPVLEKGDDRLMIADLGHQDLRADFQDPPADFQDLQQDLKDLQGIPLAAFLSEQSHAHRAKVPRSRTSKIYALKRS